MFAPQRPEITLVPAHFSTNIADAADALMAMDAQIYQRQLKLVHPDLVEIDAATVEVPLPNGETGPNGETTERQARFTTHWELSPVDVVRLRKKMMDTTFFFKHNKKAQQVPTICPLEIAQGLISDPSCWPFPPLAGISEIPWVRPSGQVVYEPGYDAESRMLLKFDQAKMDFSDIPRYPLKDDAMHSKQAFLKLFEGFPFVDEVARAVAFSMLFSLIMRGVVDFVPLHALTAPQAGTGKSFLVDLILMLVTGRLAPAMEQGCESPPARH